MDKPGKVILIGIVLLAIAVPLGFFIKYNFSQRLAKMTSQGIDFGLGLDSLGAIDKAKEAGDLTDQTNQEITQMIENIMGATTSPESSEQTQTTSSLEEINANEATSTD
ncbi:MAG: hypothetical protein PHY72_01160 [Candidatus Pacebacteria bacterium]|nr:hypothetical protein [Candidatus Paceibacterota bacterium]